MSNITIDKTWNENERVTERNNRIYTSAGRWQWIVSVDGEIDSAHDTKFSAKNRAESVRRALEAK